MSIAQQIPLTNAENIERENRRYNSSCQELWSVLDQVKDPEIPVITIWELGVLQNVTRSGDQVTVTITPTYSGCPAMEVIKEDILAALSSAGIYDVVINTQLSPAWTTDWLSSKAKASLKEFGIATINSDNTIVCPQCGCNKTNQISEFGSTSCKALYQCLECHEAFDLFKSL